MSNYIQDVSALIRISEFLNTVANKDHLDKKKAYAASRLNVAIDNAVVDLVSNPKFMDFVAEISEAQTLAQSEKDLKRLMEEHQRDLHETFVGHLTQPITQVVTSTVDQSVIDGLHKTASNAGVAAVVQAEQNMEHVREVDHQLHEDRVHEKQVHADQVEKVGAGKKIPAEPSKPAPEAPKKKKSPGFRKVKD